VASEGDYISARHDEETKAIINDIVEKKINKSDFIRDAIKHYYHRQMLNVEIALLKNINEELANTISTIKNGINHNIPQIDKQTPIESFISDDDILLAGLNDIIGGPDIYDDNEVNI